MLLLPMMMMMGRVQLLLLLLVVVVVMVLCRARKDLGEGLAFVEMGCGSVGGSDDGVPGAAT